ncbi:hypothetical protein H257_15804 [Aphanomyces astaci]|uniref:Uncharacterized protein n=1 Tax=Aphanomyces astaci TaxID=112090 RepID=W4FL72_APHAT|nr:hypothetical protein H257_15804 [Aphanomyces astaci]ETV68235.1 hypothetical protein H257_15804 [Aphanomyces astaci]|eukprot:XP_009842320.1 hypothetical protein H257_15804 [Aphanomyces astaci]
MDIVHRIGQYFAQHEQNMSDVMKQALERSQSLVPDAPHVKPPRAVRGSFFSAKKTSKPPPSSTSPSSPRPVFTEDSSLCCPKASTTNTGPTPPTPTNRVKAKRKGMSRPKQKKTSYSTPPSTTAADIALKQSTALALQEAWRLTCERAKKIQADQEAKLKAEQELERQEKAKLDSQLQQIETARSQAFAKQPRPPPPSAPKSLHCAEAWCEPRRVGRKYQRHVKPSMPALRACEQPATSLRSSELTTATTPRSSCNNNNDHPGMLQVFTNLNPVTKFGPVPSSTPSLDELETSQRTKLLEYASALSKVREKLQHQRSVATFEATQNAQCKRREASNASLVATIEQLQLEKERWEQSLRTLQTDEAALRSERHRLTMERRMARRAAKTLKCLETPEAIEMWAQEERVRAAQAKEARDRAKRRVQQRTGDATIVPETFDEAADEQHKEGWHVSPLSSSRFQKAFFTYSSSSDDNN